LHFWTVMVGMNSPGFDKFAGANLDSTRAWPDQLPGTPAAPPFRAGPRYLCNIRFLFARPDRRRLAVRRFLRCPMRSAIFPPLLVALIATAPAHAGVCPARANEQAAAEVRGAFTAWNEAVLRKDLDKTMAIFSPSLHFQFQGAPDFGYARLREVYSSNFARENAPVWHPVVENVIASSDMVTLFNEWRLIPAGGGDPISEYRGVDVFQREADCVWRVTASLNYADKSALAVSPNPAGRSIGPAQVSTGKSQPLVAARDGKPKKITGGPR
jgi:ketosteroid isomerase-like protein